MDTGGRIMHAGGRIWDTTGRILETGGSIVDAVETNWMLGEAFVQVTPALEQPPWRGLPPVPVLHRRGGPSPPASK